MPVNAEQDPACRLGAVGVTHDRLAQLRVTLARLVAVTPGVGIKAGHGNRSFSVWIRRGGVGMA